MYRMNRAAAAPHPYPRPSGAGQSSPPDGLGSQALSSLARAQSVRVMLAASRVRKPGFARP